ncbi:RAMP superfamily CRISPR-associated protein [Candidatus Chloroploca sp. Khr17]|uniref:RAMP superfamily CRISPR-associated protein n=1 Tax=Candidatus Chloroploca sp. Khr17 TaxID=2496869 RepID=UPI00101DEE13|nr:RAMP superfamily CRISPR-associated protein [Candidatus Chloroploca sp. Khr17]
MTANPLADAMPPRPVEARWVICGLLTLETALHLGGSASERIDMPVLRDSREGKPLLPGTTLAGALRSALTDRLAGYWSAKPESSQVAHLFGGWRGDDDGSQSPLIVFDALGQLPDAQGIEIRDGVAIDPTSGTAEDQKKYDYEVVPAGTTFPIRIDLLLPVPGSRHHPTPPTEQELLASLAMALDALTHGETAFGARRSRGLGRVRAVWSARRFDLSSAVGWRTWIGADHQQPNLIPPSQVSIRDVLEAAAPAAFRPLELALDRRERVVIALNLQVVHDILVRSPSPEPLAPDVTHLQSGGAPILPGTSLAGVMRAHALRIARLVRDHHDAEAWIERLFGPRFEGQSPTNDRQPRASRVRISEARLTQSHPQTQTRVALDRFTQGTVPTALFDEQTDVAGRATVHVELWKPHEGELGLILLVLKDLLAGWLPVGGTTNVGRGVLQGQATVTWYDGDGKPPRLATIQPGAYPSGTAAQAINQAITAFHEAKSLQQTAR